MHFLHALRIADRLRCQSSRGQPPGASHRSATARPPAARLPSGTPARARLRCARRSSVDSDLMTGLQAGRMALRSVLELSNRAEFVAIHAAARSVARRMRRRSAQESVKRGGRMGSKIEGDGTYAPPSVCLHIGLRTAARDGSAVTRRKRRWIKELSGAAFAVVRLDTLVSAMSREGNG